MLIDLHVHTKEVSRCSEIPAREVVKTYKEQTAYDAIVITEHINACLFGEEMFGEKWQETITRYMSGYKTAKEEGDKLGLKVFFGCELALTTVGDNDFLLYGVTEQFLRDNVNINRRPLKEVSQLCRDNGILLYKAHPFRNGMVMVDPSLLFGIETANGHPGHNSRNDFANLWADMYGLSKIGGSDFHHPGQHGRSGIITRTTVNDEKELVEVLKSGDYMICSDINRGF